MFDPSPVAPLDLERSTLCRALLEDTTDLVAVVSSDTTVRYVSPSVAAIGGYAPAEVTGRSFLELLAEDDRGLATERLAAAVGGALASAELRFRRRDGTWRVLECHARGRLGAARLGGVVVNARDVTERKAAADRAARQSDALGRVAAHPGMLSGDFEAVAREATEAASAATGVERANVWLFDDSETELRCVDLYEATPGSHSHGMVLHEREFGPEFRALKDKQYVDAHNPFADPRTAGYVESDVRPLGITSMLDAVVRASGRNLGLLCLEHVGRPHRWADDEIAFACRLADKLAFAMASRGRRDSETKLRRSLDATIEAIAATLEMRDPYTAGHQARVAALAAAIAREMGLDAERIEGLRLAATIHDIGKIRVPAEILAKPGRLGAAEFELIKGHCAAGYDIVKGIAFPWPIAQMIRQHHERLDGSGYPDGLRGDAILLEARILAVADVVEAMSSHRPYRPALGVEAALAEIAAGRASRFDPAAVDACLALFRERRYSFEPAQTRSESQ